jgi:hypothetical protein
VDGGVARESNKKKAVSEEVGRQEGRCARRWNLEKSVVSIKDD